jgi:hypothetical protein
MMYLHQRYNQSLHHNQSLHQPLIIIHQNTTINYYGFNKSVYKLPPMGQFKYEWEKLRFNSIFLMATITTPFYE